MPVSCRSTDKCSRDGSITFHSPLTLLRLTPEHAKADLEAARRTRPWTNVELSTELRDSKASDVKQTTPCNQVLWSSQVGSQELWVQAPSQQLLNTRSRLVQDCLPRDTAAGDL